MPVARLIKSLIKGLITVLVLAGAAMGQQTVPENSVTLDLYSFDQRDRGGNPLMAEDFRYNSIRTSASPSRRSVAASTARTSRPWV